MSTQFKFGKEFLILVFFILHAPNSFAEECADVWGEPMCAATAEYAKSCEGICYGHAMNRCGDRAYGCAADGPPVQGRQGFGYSYPPCSVEEYEKAKICVDMQLSMCQRNTPVCKPSLFEKGCRILVGYGVNTLTTNQCDRYVGRIKWACYVVGAGAAFGTYYVSDICGWYW